MNKGTIALTMGMITLPVAIAFSQPGPTAPKQYTLSVSQSDLQIIGQGLGKLPYSDVAQLMSRLQAQIIAQDAPPKATVTKPPVDQSGNPLPAAPEAKPHD